MHVLRKEDTDQAKEEGGGESALTTGNSLGSLSGQKELAQGRAGSEPRAWRDSRAVLKCFCLELQNAKLQNNKAQLYHPETDNTQSP